MSSEQHEVNVVVNAQDNASPVLSRLSKMGTMGFGAMAKLGANAMDALTGGVGGFARSTLSLGQNFTSSMSEVAAISGATGSDLEALEATAREMGAATIFSASQAADGLKYMAMAGWNTQQMTAGLPAVLNLAAASGEDLGKTSDIVTDALTAFGLQAEDAEHFTNVLAMTSNKANTNVSMLGESFKYVAPVAGAMGYSVEDTSVALGLMANSGIKASSAGTQLRTLMANMSSPTKQMSQAMSELGISLTDSEGNMKSFGQITDDLRGAFSGLTEEQKAQYASTIAGTEGMSGLLAIVNASEGDVNKLRDAMSSCDGAAKQMADTMNDNLKGDLAELNSAWEELKLKLYEAVEPALRTVVQAVTTYVIPALDSLVQFISGLKLDEAFKGIDWKPLIAIAGAAGAAIVAIKGFGFLKSFNPFSNFGSKGKSTFSQLGTGLGNLFSKIMTGFGGMIKNIEAGFGQMGSSLMKGFGQMVKSIGSIPITGIANFAAVVAVLTVAFLALAACQDMVLPFLHGISDILVGLVGGVLDAVVQALLNLAPVIGIIAEGLAKLAPLITAVGTAFGTVIEAIGTAAATIIQALTPVIEIIGGIFVELAGVVTDAIVRIIEAISPFMPAVTHMVEVIAAKLPELVTAFQGLLSEIGPIIDSIGDLISDFGSAIEDVLNGLSGLIDSIGGLITAFFEGLSGVIDSIGNAAKNAGEGFEALGRGVKMIADTNLGDMAGSLAAVAAGVGAIAMSASGLGDVGQQMLALGQGLSLMGANATVAIAAMSNFGSIADQLKAVGESAPSVILASEAVQQFGTGALLALIGLTGSIPVLGNMISSLTQAGSAANIASSGLAQAAASASILGSQAKVATTGLMDIAGSASRVMTMTSAAFTSGMVKILAVVTTGMSQVSQVFNCAISSTAIAGTQIGQGLVNGFRATASRLPSIARSMISSAVTAMSGYYYTAYQAGSYLGQGLADGMASQLGRVSAVASRLAQEADKAARAAAKVKSPSRVFMETGRYLGEGLAIGMEKTKDMVAKAADSLIQTPSISGGIASVADESFVSAFASRSGDVVLNVRQIIDGREFARSTARFTKDELDRTEQINLMIRGER